MYQLTYPTPTTTQLWDWKVNVAAATPGQLSGTASWSLQMQYARPNRNDNNTLTNSVAANAAWSVDYGGNFYGGTFTLIATYASLASNPLVFYVRGRNPSVADAQAYIGNSPFYAQAIAQQESGTQVGRSFLQFNEVGSLGPDWSQIQFCPNRSSDGIGWGMYQLTSEPVTTTQLWNWKANVDRAKALMAANNATATTWINSQISQQQAQDPSQPLANYPFTWASVVFQMGTSKTPIDACAIEAFNGVTPGWAVWWASNPYQWKQRDNVNNYITKVCGYL